MSNVIYARARLPQKRDREETEHTIIASVWRVLEHIEEGGLDVMDGRLTIINDYNPGEMRDYVLARWEPNE